MLPGTAEVGGPRSPELIRGTPSIDWGGARPLWTDCQPLQHGESPIRGRQGLLGFQIPGWPGATQLHIQATEGGRPPAAGHRWWPNPHPGVGQGAQVWGWRGCSRSNWSWTPGCSLPKINSIWCYRSAFEVGKRKFVPKRTMQGNWKGQELWSQGDQESCPGHVLWSVWLWTHYWKMLSISSSAANWLR